MQLILMCYPTLFPHITSDNLKLHLMIKISSIMKRGNDDDERKKILYSVVNSTSITKGKYTNITIYF